MQLPTELPSGKILDLARFIALIPVENTPQKNYELILEGYSSAISLEQDDAKALKKLLQSDLKISTTEASTWDREEQLRKNQLALKLLRKRIERNGRAEGYEEWEKLREK